MAISCFKALERFHDRVVEALGRGSDTVMETWSNIAGPVKLRF
jgi:hypothetical protein